MIKADAHDYCRGYKKHLQLYKKLRNDESHLNGRRLLLIYSVECGLKYLLLKQWNKFDCEEIQDDDQRKVITSHNLERMVKELGQQGNFHFKTLNTIHHDVVTSGEYHQMYRYGIRITDKEEREKDVEESLVKVADWIEERM